MQLIGISLDEGCTIKFAGSWADEAVVGSHLPFSFSLRGVERFLGELKA